MSVVAPFKFNHLHAYTLSELPPVHAHADLVRATVLRALGVEISSLVGTTRHPRVVAARMLCVRLLRTHSILSYPEIALAVTPGRGHSSVITMDQRLTRAMDVVVEGRSLAAWLARLDTIVRNNIGFNVRVGPA